MGSYAEMNPILFMLPRHRKSSTDGGWPGLPGYQTEETMSEALQQTQGETSECALWLAGAGPYDVANS